MIFNVGFTKIYLPHISYQNVSRYISHNKVFRVKSINIILLFELSNINFNILLTIGRYQ